MYSSEISSGPEFFRTLVYGFIALIAVMGAMTVTHPLSKPVDMPVRHDIDIRPSPMARRAGLGIVVATAVLYGVFW